MLSKVHPMEYIATFKYMIVTNPADLKSLVSFLKAFRTHQVVMSFEDTLKIYAMDVESINSLKAEVKIKQQTPLNFAIKVNLDDLKEPFNSLDKEADPTLEINLNQKDLLMEALFTFPNNRTIRVCMLYQPIDTPTWEKITFPLSWTMSPRAFKKSFSNQGQIEIYVYVTSTPKQLILETNKMHRVVCSETFKDPKSIKLYSEGSQEFLISLYLIKRNLNFPTCKELIISCSKDVLQFERRQITIRTRC